MNEGEWVMIDDEMMMEYERKKSHCTIESLFRKLAMRA